MHNAVERSAEATLVPMTAADFREHGRVIQTAEDTIIEKYIQVARTYYEDVNDMTFLTTTWKAYWERFETPLIIPRPPYVTVTTLTYTNENGVETPITEGTDFVVDSKSMFATIKPYEGLSWPSDVEDDGYNAVTLTFVAGYTAATLIPEPWLQGLRLAVEVMYDRMGPYASAIDARFPMPFNNMDVMLGAYSVPQI